MLSEIANYLQHICLIDASPSTIMRTLHRRGFTRKKVLFNLWSITEALELIFHRWHGQQLNRTSGIVQNSRCLWANILRRNNWFSQMKATLIVFHTEETMPGPLEATALGGVTSLFVAFGKHHLFWLTTAQWFCLGIPSFLPFLSMASFTLKWLITPSLGAHSPILYGVCWIRCNHGHSQTQCLWWIMHVYTRFQVYGRWLKSGRFSVAIHCIRQVVARLDALSSISCWPVFLFQWDAAFIPSSLLAGFKSHWKGLLKYQILAAIKSYLCSWL